MKKFNKIEVPYANLVMAFTLFVGMIGTVAALITQNLVMGAVFGSLWASSYILEKTIKRPALKGQDMQLVYEAAKEAGWQLTSVAEVLAEEEAERRAKHERYLEEERRRAAGEDIPCPSMQEPEQPEWMRIMWENPAYGMMCYRMELEVRLRALVEATGVSGKKMTINPLLKSLETNKVLVEAELRTIRLLTASLNKASHGGEIDDSAMAWLRKNGEPMLSTLERKRKAVTSSQLSSP